MDLRFVYSSLLVRIGQEGRRWRGWSMRSDVIGTDETEDHAEDEKEDEGEKLRI